MELDEEYYERFGKCISLPFGASSSDAWTDETYIREYEIALNTGIPFEPGTKRWRKRFGGTVNVPRGIFI